MALSSDLESRISPSSMSMSAAPLAPISGMLASSAAERPPVSEDAGELMSSKSPETTLEEGPLSPRGLVLLFTSMSKMDLGGPPPPPPADGGCWCCCCGLLLGIGACGVECLLPALLLLEWEEECRWWCGW